MCRNKIFSAFLFILVFSSTLNLIAQEFGKGLLLEEELYQNTPVIAPLMRGDFQNLPSLFSLKEYAPSPGFQGLSGTCTGWSTAYGGRTILAAISNKWNKSEIDNNSFSPYFIYNLIKGPSDSRCRNGASLDAALKALKDIGCLKISDFENTCKNEVEDVERKSAEEFRIFKYRELFYDKTGDDFKVSAVKKSLAEFMPVVIGMHWPFEKTTGDVIEPTEEEYASRSAQGHSVIVVGYDDNKYGGSFELMNSWGKNWANKGFVWIKYPDFKKFCYMAFELFEQPVLQSQNVPDLSGSVQLVNKSGELIELNKFGGFFETKKPLAAGTFFRVVISNNEPAYVYAAGFDSNEGAEKLFPFNERMVAFLPYKQSNFALPDEDHYYMIDESQGATYFCFFYSSKELDLQSILSYPGISGNPIGVLPEVLKKEMYRENEINYTVGENVSFEAKSPGHKVVAVLIKIKGGS